MGCSGRNFHPFFKIDQRLKIEKFTSNKLTNKYLPNSGIVLSDNIIKKQHYWYKIQLNNKIINSLYSGEFVFIRPKDIDLEPELDNGMIVALFLIINNEYLQSDNIEMMNTAFIGWAKIYG